MIMGTKYVSFIATTLCFHQDAVFETLPCYCTFNVLISMHHANMLGMGACFFALFNVMGSVRFKISCCIINTMNE